MSRFTRLLIMGATGLVGRELLRLLAEREFPCPELVVAASPASAGRPLHQGDRRLTIQDVTRVATGPGDLVFFTGHDDLAAEMVPQVVASGALVIDNSATFRQEPHVPLVVPEVNGAALQQHQGLIANPNCTTITFVVPLAALEAAYGLRWVSVASYQSISGAGTAAYEDFQQRHVEIALEGRNSDASRLPLNVIPAIGSVGADGSTSEETKMRLETRKILGLPDLPVFGTAVRVPVQVGHLCAVHVAVESVPEDVGAVRALLASAPGVVVQDDPVTGLWPTPVGVAGTDPVAVGRVRLLEDGVIGLVAAADNLRKGAALNALQIAEALLALPD